MVLINPLTPFPYPTTPLGSGTPLTYREGITVLGLIEALKRWIEESVAPELHAAIELAVTEFTEGLTNAENTIIANKLEWQELFDNFMENIALELQALNDEAVTNLVKNSGSQLSNTLNEIFTTKDEFDSAMIKNSIVVNVMDHGATGLGVVDETASIQAAVNFASPGDVIWFPNGDYVLSSFVELKSNITVTGAPGANIIKRVGYSSYCCFIATSKARTGYGNGSQGITIDGLTFTGDIANNVGVNIIAAHRAGNLTVKNCTVNGAVTSGHVFDLQGCNSVFIENNTIRGANYSSSGYQEAIQIDCSARAGLSYGGAIAGEEFFDGLACKDIYVRGNKFLPLTINSVAYPSPVAVGSHGYVDGFPYDNIFIENNVIVEPGGNDSTSSFAGTFHFVGAKNVFIKNNSIKAIVFNKNQVLRTFNGVVAIPLGQVNEASPVTETAIYPQQPDNIVFSGNEIIGVKCSDSVIRVYGTLNLRGSDLKVVNNSFKDCVPTLSTSGVVRAYEMNSVSVKNNFSDNSRIFFTMQFGDYIIVDQNISKTHISEFIIISDVVRVVCNGNILSKFTRLSISNFDTLQMSSNDVVTEGDNFTFLLTNAAYGKLGTINIGNNNITNTSALTVARYGIYAQATNIVKGIVIGNVLKGFTDSGISIAATIDKTMNVNG